MLPQCITGKKNTTKLSDNKTNQKAIQLSSLLFYYLNLPSEGAGHSLEPINEKP